MVKQAVDFRRRIDEARIAAPTEKPTRYRAALEAAIGQLFGRERYRMGLRLTEIERRLAELERR